MPHIVDLHIHSRYAYATSKHMNLEELYFWGKLKGITVIGTGDFTHPTWFQELQTKLELTESGLCQLKPEHAQVQDQKLPASVKDQPLYFIPTVEISCIYHRHSKLRKVHNLIVVPSLEIAGQLNRQLGRLGNLAADGRPTLGLDSYDLLKLSLQLHPHTLFIPAHVWTPWFGIFGSKSGFDSLEEAFGDLSPQVYAIETGLSSDPAMNRQITSLSQVTITSHSDAHSLHKLGREATLLNCELNYLDIINAIKTNDQRLAGTIEFFPQEGKYHYDGHRNCKVSFSPAQSQQLNHLCPVCGRQLTLGVLNRVQELRSHSDGILMSQTPQNDNNKSSPHTNKQVDYIVPLEEIIADLKGIKNPLSRSVQQEHHQLIAAFGNEFSLLREVGISDMVAQGYPQLAQAIASMRQGQVIINPGYDGVYGTIKIKQTTKALQERLL